MRRTFRRGLRVLSACAAVAGATLVPALAEVTVEQDAQDSTRHHIVVSGAIDLFTLYAFAKALGDPRIAGPLPPRVGLNSPGGSVAVAMAIGYLIRNRGFDTGVDRRQECHSACVLILAAGARRGVAAARVGIHRPHMGQASLLGPPGDEARAAYERTTGDMRRYLKDMGMADGLLPAMLEVPSHRIRQLSLREMRTFGLVSARTDRAASAATEVGAPGRGHRDAQPAGKRRSADRRTPLAARRDARRSAAAARNGARRTCSNVNRSVWWAARHRSCFS